MNRACQKWKDCLLEAALTGTVTASLAGHLESCVACSAELKTLEARRARLDQLLPLVAQSAEPSHDFRARVLAAADASTQESPWRVRSAWRIWVVAGTAAVVAGVLLISIAINRNSSTLVLNDELAAAQKLAEWRAPSDGLLSTPGQEFLRNVPKFGKSYLDIPARKNQED